MDNDLFEILRRSENDAKLGAVAKEALQFVGGAKYKILQTPGPGKTSSSVVRMYKIRMGLEKFKRDAFAGLDETIEALRERERTVHLSVIEMEKGVISVWLADSGQPVGIVIAKFVSKTVTSCDIRIR